MWQWPIGWVTTMELEKLKKRPARTKLWQILKGNSQATGHNEKTLLEYLAKPVTQAEWLRGYKQWQKTKQKQKNPTQK